MRTLLLLWVALAGAGAQLPCPHGGPCPVTPVSAQGLGGLRGSQQGMITPSVPPQALPARSERGCQDSSSCPPTSCQLPEVSPIPRASVSPLSLPFGEPSLTPFSLPRVSLALGATTAVPEGPTAALMGSPVSQTWVWGHRVRGGPGGNRMDTRMPHLSPQPPVLSPVLMASLSVPMMPHAV